MSEQRSLIVDGMHGLGDNIHQRAIVRYLLAEARDDVVLWLRTPWPCLYHDLVGERLRLISPASTLRTQRKNLMREHDRYSSGNPPRGLRSLRVWYDYKGVRETGSFMGGMARLTLGHVLADADFRLPVPAAWQAKAAAHVGRPDQPIMVLRPLVERREWGGCAARNPDPAHYAALFMAIRSRFHVVSIADLVPNTEWIVGPVLPADQTFHAGELDAEAIAGLMARAALTFCSPGFAIALSQAVGTPLLCIFGGHECSRFYEYGARFAPTLGIDPVRACECFSRSHPCDKRINLAVAHERIERFIEAYCIHAADRPAIVA